jgi:hypothetical protein
MSRTALLLAALLVALAPAVPRAAAVRTAPLYPAMAAPWSGAIGGALRTAGGALPLTPILLPLASPALTPDTGYAPIAAQLQDALKLTPTAFAALPAAEQRASLELAVEAAHEDLTQKVYELAGKAEALSSPDKALDKDGRAELYRVVAQLDEMRTRYGPLLTPEETASVSDSFGRAAGRAMEIRAALLGKSMKDMGAALAGAGRDAPAAAASAPVPALPPASSGARALAESMRNNAVGWKLKDLDHLLKGYGFTLKEGGSHRKYEYPGLKPEIVPRHTEVYPNYIRSALAAIDRIESRRAPAAAPAAERAAAPASIDLDELAVLLTDGKKPAPKREQALPAGPKPAAPRSAAPKTAAAPPVSAPAPAPAPAPVAARLQPAAPRPEPEAKAEPPAPEAPAPSGLDRVRAWLKGRLGRP